MTIEVRILKDRVDQYSKGNWVHAHFFMRQTLLAAGIPLLPEVHGLTSSAGVLECEYDDFGVEAYIFRWRHQT